MRSQRGPDDRRQRGHGVLTGCSDHGLPHCLCDVEPLSAGVPIKTVPFAERLLELGITRRSFVTWAEEISAWQESQTLQLAVEA